MSARPAFDAWRPLLEIFPFALSASAPALACEAGKDSGHAMAHSGHRRDRHIQALGGGGHSLETTDQRARLLGPDELDPLLSELARLPPFREG